MNCENRCNNITAMGGINMTVASQVKQTLAALKGSQGTLRLYALQAREEESKLVVRPAWAVTWR
jgi:hypothetical protein